MIIEMKDKPESVESVVSEENGKLMLVITVQKESSAADIDLDISSSELKL